MTLRVRCEGLLRLRQFPICGSCFSHFIRTNDFLVKLEGINLDFSTGAQTTAGRMRRKTTSLNLEIRSQAFHREVTVILKINE